jgi:hypothetical protein
VTSVRAGDGLGAIRERVHRLLLDRAEALGLHVVTGPERRLRVREQAFGLLREEGVILSQAAMTRLINEVSDQVVGLGPIAEGPGGHRGDGERARRRIRGARGAHREGAGRSIRGGGGRPASDGVPPVSRRRGW